MKIKLICVGKLKEPYWVEAEKEYLKRMKRFSGVEIIEVAEEPCKENPSEAEILQVKEAEGQRLIRKVIAGEFCIAMDLQGKQLTSEAFACKLSETMLKGISSISFLIGGSYGLSGGCIQRADFQLCMSAFTFPHQLARIILLEQIYRTMKINARERYHK